MERGHYTATLMDRIYIHNDDNVVDGGQIAADFHGNHNFLR